MRYQRDYSRLNPSVLDGAVRKVKARKILAVLTNYLAKRGVRLKDQTCIDIGGSCGLTARWLAPSVKKIYVVDIDQEAISLGEKAYKVSNLHFIRGDAMNLPFADGSFDVAVCNQVYEHVPDSSRLAKEIYRILRPGGICYFGAGNRYCLREWHYNLYFLSWLPKTVANFYVRIMGKGRYYYENLMSLGQLRKLLSKFIVHDYTVNVIKDPATYHALDTVARHSLATKIPRWILEAALPAFPGYIFVLEKK
jgi:ubiquinone/menaquinone biosynthesis C-methylase UbiE